MKLFLVHCGFYDLETGDGIYESHVNLLVAAEDFTGAGAAAKNLPQFIAKRMHVDGLQEIEAVAGYRIALKSDAALDGQTILHSLRHRDLAPGAGPPALSSGKPALAPRA